MPLLITPIAGFSVSRRMRRHGRDGDGKSLMFDVSKAGHRGALVCLIPYRPSVAIIGTKQYREFARQQYYTKPLTFPYPLIINRDGQRHFLYICINLKYDGQSTQSTQPIHANRAHIELTFCQFCQFAPIGAKNSKTRRASRKHKRCQSHVKFQHQHLTNYNHLISLHKTTINTRNSIQTRL